MAHRMVGRLRGRGEPPASVLDRLEAINPAWRVHWTPWYDDQWYWLIGNEVGSAILRATGRERLARLTALAMEDGGAQRDRVLHPAHIAGCELMADGQWIVRRYTEAQFGTDWMFADLAQVRANMEHLSDEERAARDRRRRSLEYRTARDEASRNRALQAYLDDFELEHPGFLAEQEAMLKESWSYYMRGARSVVVATSEGAT